jgi:NAD(P)-dependent dehydrogenase (short-subunit alcohol dehydrogenase family)
MEKLRNIIVTGSNKGIGYGIVENLAQKHGWNIIMACRNLEAANKAKD